MYVKHVVGNTTKQQVCQMQASNLEQLGKTYRQDLSAQFVALERTCSQKNNWTEQITHSRMKAGLKALLFCYIMKVI